MQRRGVKTSQKQARWKIRGKFLAENLAMMRILFVIALSCPPAFAR